MGTTYICKCGREISKSTTAENTGNHDTAGCTGCPYLLPYGKFEYKPGGFQRDVQGYECRMSPSIDYTTTYMGQADDKCTLRIVSLDFDFLDKVQAWINAHADGNLSGGFSREDMRGTDFSNNGRYSWSIACAQNRKGMAAKAALIEHFFGPDRRRLDKTQAEEKAIVLAAIEVGKAKDNKKEKKMDYIISECERNDLLYAYYKKEFWFWDEHQNKWVVSDFARARFEKALQTSPQLTPEDFMTNGDEFWELDEWEVSTEQINALELVKVERKVAGPEEESSDEPEENPEMLARIEPEAVAENTTTTFDYSGLDEQTVVDLHLAEREYAAGKKLTEMGLRRMADAVAIAHDAIVANCENGKDGKFTAHDDTFLRWCVSVGLKKDSAYRMLQVSKLMDDSSPREQKVLEELSPSLLYAAAKPSAPAELVQAVKDGDITTHKQYQEAMAKIRSLESENKQLKHENEMERKEQQDANAAALHYKNECDRRAKDQQRVEGLLKTTTERAENAEAEAHRQRCRAEQAESDGDKMQDIVDDLQDQLDASAAHIKDLESGRAIEATVVDQDEINSRVQDAVQAENDKWETICNSLQKKIDQLQNGDSLAAKVLATAKNLEYILTPLLREAERSGALMSMDDVNAIDELRATLDRFSDDFHDVVDAWEEDEDVEE